MDHSDNDALLAYVDAMMDSQREAEEAEEEEKKKEILRTLMLDPQNLNKVIQAKKGEFLIPARKNMGFPMPKL